MAFFRFLYGGEIWWQNNSSLTDSLLGRGNYHVNLSLGPGIIPSNYKDTLAILIKYFVSHRPPSREGGSVGQARKKRINTWLHIKSHM